MKIYFYICLIISFSLLVACEKDDICAETTPTTPQLVITFKDANNINESKAVESLAVYAIENNELTLIETINGINADSIAIPLRNDIGISNFKFYKNHSQIDGVIQGEENHFYLDYNIVDIFVSRACGFINNYIDLSALNYDPNIFGAPNGVWISGYEVINQTVENENQAHVNIFH
jgi:hypothetical protein